MRTSLLTLLAILLLTGTDIVRAQPKLVVEGAKFDLDTLNAGTVAERKITLKNAGSEELVFGKVEPSCGCTGSIVSNSNLKPGETGTLLITFNSKNFSGKIHKTVTINSNDPQSPKSVVEFTGFIVEEVALSDTRFAFKDATVGEKQTAAVTLTNNSKVPLELKGSTTTLEGLTLKYPSTVKPGESVQIVAEFLPKEAKKVVSTNITIETNNTNKPEILLYVFGNVKEWKFD